MMITGRGLCKAERLCNRAVVGELFRKGESFVSYPYRVVYRIRQGEEQVPALRFMVSVGKKYSKRAVRRNLIKRRTKEAFRLNKSVFYQYPAALSIDSCYIYIAKEEEQYDVIEHGIRKAIRKLAGLVPEGGGLAAGGADPLL